ncbi:hypothetical protein ABZY09_16370 [Streptomyces sp. NPDC002928]|uniref:hypothetical protein n=1 Tax=Streptomyces sp. NPDC002928 TaxID=3154440 RepID=UPI0033AE395F
MHRRPLTRRPAAALFLAVPQSQAATGPAVCPEQVLTLRAKVVPGNIRPCCA